ncbi:MULTISPECIES: LysR substrate-binding domain-containing protein [unclassified Sporosarcina]|uniref:LysR substrate-binding domain-containing protein n=1 Tax=Sporosarcina sp. P12(2017) TaxID=2048561 RepID=UPI00210084BC|nr:MULTISPECIES: LysR substrate-binding domain-containing protein [unclassified Sporosarcina]
MADLVASHQLDIGIVEGHFSNSQLIVEELSEDSMVIVASAEHSPILRKAQVGIIDLENETWIVREQGSGTREATEKLFQLFEITPAKLMQFSSTQSIKVSLEAGLGISLLSQWAIQKEFKNGDLKVIRIKGLPLSRQFSIVTKTSFQTKALKVFIDLLRMNKILTTL